jgi:hypothetical protein
MTTALPPQGARPPAPAPATAPANAATEAWQRALLRVRQEPLRVLMQRAAVSGHLLDVASARLAHRRCVTATAGIGTGLTSVPPPTVQMDAARREHLAAVQQACEGLMDRQPSTLALRDDAGWGALAEPLLAALSHRKPADEAQHQALLAALRATGSAELLSATADIWRPKDLAALGLPPGPPMLLPEAVREILAEKLPDLDLSRLRLGSDTMTDAAMFQLALQIEACRRGGYCIPAALEMFHCALGRLCVDDLQQMPARHILPGAATPSFVYGGDTLSPAERQARWQAMEALVQRLLPPPAPR